MRVAVLSDVHGNVHALRSALEAVDRFSPDQTVFLGDLLTYGPDVEAVMDLVEDRVHQAAVLIVGNHDQLYIDLAHGRTAYYESLPGWIRESVDYSSSFLDMDRFARLPWLEEWSQQGTLFSHANPFGSADWTYLNSQPGRARAGSVLRERGFVGGVFGHTHRAFVETHCGVRLANPGSVGQPRDDTHTSSWMLVEIGAGEFTFSVHAITYDVDAYLTGLKRTGLSEEAVRRLAGFVRSPSAP